jgi:hypothetical protein
MTTMPSPSAISSRPDAFVPAASESCSELVVTLLPRTSRQGVGGTPAIRAAWTALLAAVPHRLADQIVRSGFTILLATTEVTLLAGSPGSAPVEVPTSGDLITISRAIRDSAARLSRSERKAMLREVDGLVEAGIVERVPPVPATGTRAASGLGPGPWHYSPLFGLRKESGKLRVILNLKAVNPLFRCVPLRLTALKDFLAAVRPGWWLAKTDLKDAFHSVPVNPTSRDLLRFRFLGRDYRYTRLPQGAAFSPGVFAAVMEPVISMLQMKFDVIAVGYLDDVGLAHPCRRHLRRVMLQLPGFLTSLGLTVSVEKHMTDPTQRLPFLGFIVDSRKMRIEVPPERLRDTRREAVRLGQSGRAPLRAVARVAGRLEAMRPAFPRVRLLMVHLRNWLQREQREHRDWDAITVLPGPVREELLLLHGALRPGPAARRQLLVPPPTHLLVTDASLTGWGAWTAMYPRGVPPSDLVPMVPAIKPLAETGQFWSARDRRWANSISSLEARAVELGLRALGPLSLPRGSRVAVVTDSRVTFHALRSLRSRVPQLAHQTWSTHRTADSLGVTIDSVHWIGTKANTRADSLSRETHDPSDWKLDPHAFTAVTETVRATLGASMMVDAFATSANRQATPEFWSARPDPGSSGIDAFSMDWSHKTLWVNPPFLLMQQVINKWSAATNCTMVLIAPSWPQRAWWTTLRWYNRTRPWGWSVPRGTVLFSPGLQGSATPGGPTKWETLILVLSTDPEILRTMATSTPDSLRWKSFGATVTTATPFFTF